jgi:nucleotide-binding universal stress UspA family protein
MPTLLFADDGSLEADRAWLWVQQQRWSRWGLEILTCVPPLLGSSAGDRPSAASHERVVPATLDHDSVKHLVVEEDPRLALTGRDDVDLVVIGQRGRGALKSLHLGSTAEYVVQHLAAPTLIAKKASTVRSVLVAADGSVHAQRAVDALLSMPWLEQIDALRVIGLCSTGMYDDRTEISAAVDATIQRLSEERALSCDAAPVVLDDSPSRAILDESTAMSADLIVLGTRGKSALQLGLLWGSTARSVIKLAESSVLVAHSP